MDINFKLVPVECFLHRIFPAGHYAEIADQIVELRSFRPRKDCQDFILEFPLDWEAFEFDKDRNWRMQLQGWTFFHPIMNFFDEYHNKGSVLDYFFEAAYDWCNNYGSDPNDIVTSRMPSSYAWYDMSVGFRALVIAFFKNRIDTLNLPVKPEQLVLLNEIALKHIAHLSHEPVFSMNNHGIFQAQGLMSLLVMFPQLASEPKKVYALELMERLVSSQFDVNGVHIEHSPHYHFYVLATFDAVLESGWFEGSKAITERVHKARDTRKWIVDPLRRPICIGDSILTEQRSFEFPKTASSPIFSDFDSSGYQVLRSGWATPADKATMVFLMGAFFSKTHKHRDCLSFDWFDQGARIICDGGKYGYKSDKYRHYCLSYAAHNSVEIEGFDILKISPYGSAITPSQSLPDGVYKLGGKYDFPAIKHTRSIYVKPGKWLIVEDELNFVRKRAAAQWFHLETDYSLVSAQRSAVSVKGKNGRQLFIECLDDEAEVAIFYGDEEAMAGFVSSNDYEISPALTLSYKFQCDVKTVRTVFALSQSARSDALSFAAVNLNDPAALLADVSVSEKSGNLLPNIKHNKLSDEKSLQLKKGPNTYAVMRNNICINFFADAKALKKRKLLIMLPGASNRTKGYLDFQRYSWSEDFPNHDVIAFSDPTLKATNDIGLGWFQYNKDNYGISALASVITDIMKTGGYAGRDVALFGSSGGGFGALQLSNFFPGSKVVAINPQIYLYNYNKSYYNKMLDTCYSGMDHKSVFNNYKDRIALSIDFERRDAGTYIFQNIHDESHLVRHLLPFMKNIDRSLITKTNVWPAAEMPQNKLNVILYDDEVSGHSPPARKITVEFLHSLL